MYSTAPELVKAKQESPREQSNQRMSMANSTKFSDHLKETDQTKAAFTNSMFLSSSEQPFPPISDGE